MKFKSEKILTSVVGKEKVIYIPEGFTHIDEYVFAENSNVEKVVMPKTMRKIGREAFADCDNLKTIIFNHGIEQIGEGAFDGCGNINKIRIPGTMNITLRRSRLSGVARATIPDKQSHLITNYCTMF